MGKRNKASAVAEDEFERMARIGEDEDFDPDDTEDDDTDDTEGEDTGDIVHDEDDTSEVDTPDMPLCECSDCFSNIDGRCIALDDNDFGGEKCPFYKRFDKARREQKECFRSLVGKGRFDLIQKYRKVYMALDIFNMADDELAECFKGLAEYENSDFSSEIDDEEDDWNE